MGAGEVMIGAAFLSSVACHEGGLLALQNAADLEKFSALCARLSEVFFLLWNFSKVHSR